MSAELLRPLSELSAPRNVVSFDLESKKHGSQKQGFERPFLVGVFDSRSARFRAFFDDRSLDPSDPERSFKPGGAIDKFMSWLTTTSEGRALQSASRGTRAGSILYAHNAGGFDALHLMRWLRRPEHASRFDVRIVASGSQLLELRITPRFVAEPGKKRRTKREPKRRRKRGWTIRDSMRLVPGALDEIGRKLALEVKKTRMPASLGGLDAPEKHRGAWRRYNEADCRAAAGIVETLTRVLGELGGQLCMTLPASTMDLFRRVYLGEFLASSHVDGCDGECEKKALGGCNPLRGKPGLPRERHWPGCPAICEECHHERCSKRCKNHGKERPPCPAAPFGCLHAWLALSPTGARHGGRTEVFHHRETRSELRYFDRNSSYAAAMLEPMPLRLVAYQTPASAQDRDPFKQCEAAAARGWVGFVECTVYVPEDVHIPPLPVVFRDKLIFPVGRFHGRWDWTELRHLKEIGGRIESIDRSAWYEAAPLLAPMMRDLYARRLRAKKEGNAPLAEICKLLMNALYGKFIQSPDRQDILTAIEGDEPDGARELVAEASFSPRGNLGKPVLWGVGKHAEAPYYLPHIGAHITALAREALWLFMRDVERQGGRVHYCDTDSCLFSGADMPSSDKLGAWKREHARVRRLAGHFDSPKSYALTSLSGEPLDNVHDDACAALRKEGDEKALSCKGCATSGVHIKGLHRAQHTVENFEALLRGETVEVPDQPPKLGELVAVDFREYVTRSRKKSSHTRRPTGPDDRTEYVDKRVRVGDATRPICMTPEASPWPYVEHGRLVDLRPDLGAPRLGDVFAYVAARRAGALEAPPKPPKPKGRARKRKVPVPRSAARRGNRST